ncbi:hypothetical protein BOX15_Mlig033018g1, partial [Macrostomum lignano]
VMTHESQSPFINANNRRNLSWLNIYPAPAEASARIERPSAGLKRYHRQQTELLNAYQNLVGSGNDHNNSEEENDSQNQRERTTSDNGDGSAEQNNLSPIARTITPKSPWSPVSTPAAVWTVRRQAEASVLANILLGGCKAAAVALSGSLAVVASLIESSLQLLSGFVVWRASQKTRRRFRYSYPQGRTRLEPVAIVVLAVVMATATVQMLVRAGGEATVALAQSAGSNRSVRNVGLQVECRCGDVGNCSVGECRSWTKPMKARIVKTIGVSELTPTVVALVGASVAVKAVLLTACLASSRTRGSHSGRILAVAHFNDIVCSSLALGSAAAARYLWPYLDPIGAAVIALFIAQSWIRVLLHQIRLLTGRCADHKLLQLLIFASANHSPLITGVCSATAFHHGVQCLAEVSIQLAPDTPLRLAHDVAEKLQQRLEQIEGIERAFVHPHCGDRPCEHKVV